MQTSFFKSSLCALEKRGALQDNSRVHSVLRTVPALPDRLSLKVNPSASVNFHPSFQYSGFAITFLHAILLLLTEYDTLLHLIDCQFINMEKSVTCFFPRKTEPFILAHDTFLILS